MSVYKIHVRDQNGPVYVVAEGATPLLSFYETLKTNESYQSKTSSCKDFS